MSEELYSERRKLRRFSVTINLIYFDFSSNKVNKANVVDITNKGVGIISEEELVPNITLDLWLEIPDKKQEVHTIGEVIWVTKVGENKYRIGVNFKDAGIKSMPVVLRSMNVPT